MDFIKQMKKREFIEMGLKTLAAVLAAFLAIILMEGMIYGIQLNGLKGREFKQTYANSTTAYCIEQDDGKYFVVYRCNYNNEVSWEAIKDDYKTKEQCEAMVGKEVKDVVYHAPNAFDFSINSNHYIVITIFMSAIIGFFAYKFVILAKAYKKTEEQFKQTGTIEITNV